MLSPQVVQGMAALLERYPDLQRGYLIQGRALLELGRFTAAVKSCRTAERIANVKNTGLTEAAKLLDQIAFAAAQKGSFEGFDGRQLEASIFTYLIGKHVLPCGFSSRRKFNSPASIVLLSTAACVNPRRQSALQGWEHWHNLKHHQQSTYYVDLISWNTEQKCR